MLEEKRKIFLEKLDEIVKTKKEFGFFSKFGGPGIKRKILRLIFAPRVYILYVLKRAYLYKIEDKTKTKEINLFCGRKIYVKNDYDIFSLSETGILFSEPEIKLTKFFIKNLKENDVFYDVGANYGFYTYLALEFCKEVHSFEPLPYVFECLKMSLKDTSNVFLNNVALSDKEGELEMFIPYFHSGSTISKDRANKIGKNINQIIRVKTTTLDNYIANGKSKPTVIKLDVEGAESLIIDGGIEFFKNNNPIIAMEVWSKEEGYDISKTAVEKLIKLGYQPYFINFEGKIEKINDDISEKVESGAENIIFKKD